MAVGAGAYTQALVGTGIVLLALMILGRFEDYLLPFHFQERLLRVTMDPQAEVLEAVERHLTSLGYHVRILDIERKDDAYVVSFSARGRRDDPGLMLRQLMARPGITRVTMEGR
jgi:uncharacterized membrane protein YhiD involved in acid resistance